MMQEPDVVILGVVLRTGFLRGRSNFGTERLQSLHPWRFWKPDCRWPWAPCCHWLGSDQGTWLGQGSLQRWLNKKIQWQESSHPPPFLVFLFLHLFFIGKYYFIPLLYFSPSCTSSCRSKWNVGGSKGGLLFWNLSSAKINGLFF